jgi:hypothetical protein
MLELERPQGNAFSELVLDTATSRVTGHEGDPAIEPLTGWRVCGASPMLTTVNIDQECAAKRMALVRALTNVLDQQLDGDEPVALVRGST